jgi:hypothetical protein
MGAYIPTSRNLIGQRFDRLLVLSKQRNEHNNVVWECICGGYYLYNGIDRVDNTLGYSKENCVSCCKICNYMKQVLTLEEFYSHIRRIHERIT